MTNDAVGTVLPLFGILLAGYVSARFGLFGETASDTLNRFVFSLSFPALIFVSLARLPLGDFFHWPFVGTLMGGMATLFIVGFAAGRWVFRDRRGEAALHGLNAMFSSTGYIGLPLLLVSFGDEVLGPGVFGAVVTVAVFLPAAMLLIASEAQGSARETGKAIFKVFRSPMLIATMAGLAASASGIAVPGPIASFCDLLGAAYIPCALFSAGLFFVRCSIKGDHREVAWLVCAKLVVHPAVTWAIGYWIFGLEDILLVTATLLAALPTGVPAFVLAQQSGVFADRSSAVVVLSTAVSVVSLTLLITLLAN